MFIVVQIPFTDLRPIIPGQRGRLKLSGLTDDANRDKLAAGVQYAGDHGWIENAGGSFIRLTPEGAAAMKRAQCRPCGILLEEDADVG